MKQNRNRSHTEDYYILRERKLLLEIISLPPFLYMWTFVWLYIFCIPSINSLFNPQTRLFFPCVGGSKISSCKILCRVQRTVVVPSLMYYYTFTTYESQTNWSYFISLFKSSRIHKTKTNGYVQICMPVAFSHLYQVRVLQVNLTVYKIDFNFINIL